MLGTGFVIVALRLLKLAFQSLQRREVLKSLGSLLLSLLQLVSRLVLSVHGCAPHIRSTGPRQGCQTEEDWGKRMREGVMCVYV